MEKYGKTLEKPTFPHGLFGVFFMGWKKLQELGAKISQGQVLKMPTVGKAKLKCQQPTRPGLIVDLIVDPKFVKGASLVHSGAVEV